MIRPQPSPRRPLVVAAAALAGLATALAFTAPAVATKPSPSPSASPTGSAAAGKSKGSAPNCVKADDARYTHTFDGPKGEASITLTNGPLCVGEEQELALVSYVAPSAKFALPQYVLASSVNKFTGVAEGELGVSTLTFQVEVPTCYTQVDFVFGSTIIDPLTETSERYGDRKVGSPKGIGSRSKGPNAWYNGGSGTCVATPEVIASADCDGGVELTLVNRNGNAPAAFTVAGSNGFTRKVTVPMRTIEKLELTPAQAQTVTVTAPGMKDFTSDWEKPEDCQEPEVGTPEASYESTCDQMIFQVSNPEDGTTVTSTFTPNKGEAKTLTVEPGRSGSVSFKAGKGLTVTVTGDLDSGGPLAWEQPEDCKDGGTGGGEPEEPGLPLTGAAAGSIAAGALALLAAGVVLFVVARRRRIRFTA
ncbi:cell wall anchor protein [Micromonospora sp. KC213]|uniref:cell wall anchor protein n=1 Tax=Micromonospora sp. KC213 TaxID=2530378 RepID=UPI0010528156|nr:cell wall anchor protein [Micromonospora sp. KC213]TDC36748.1 cell wall anchor protein [Micromonospora sp. KC213]